MKNQSIPITYGIVTGLALIVYFLLLSTIGLHTNPIFSFVNAAICAVGIYACIKSYRRRQGDAFKYQNGFMAGIFTGFYATIIFTVFFGIYYANNQSFSDSLLSSIGLDLNSGLLILGVGIMGFASTLVVTLTLMQLFKKSWNTREGNRHAFHKNDDHNKPKV